MVRDSFAGFHPFVNFIYFTFVIAFSLVLTNPLAQAIALICAVLYMASIEGTKSILFLLKYCLPMVLLTAFINPAFNHAGMTVLLYFSNGNPLTLESVLYGIGAGAMLVTLLLWFASFHRVMTSDKFIYLFGKIIPVLSLVLSMTLRFVPKFKTQMNTVAEAQRSIGRDISSGSIFSRMKTAVVIFSIMITWSLENAIETADSMKSRGYGLKGRTAFSIYRFDKRDKITLLWIVISGCVVGVGTIFKMFGFRYFPNIRYMPLDGRTIPFYVMYLALCMTPAIINWKEERKWKISISNM